MQNNVREMTDDALIRQLYDLPSQFVHAEIASRLAALRAEVERLKSDKEHLIGFADNFAGQVERLTAELSKRPTEGEAVVMRELCEAMEPMVEAFGATLEFRNPWEAEYAERKVLDYRAMKGEK